MKPLAIIWALVWRATLLAPVVLVWFALAFASWLARFFLPILIGIAVYCRDWEMTAVYVSLWIVSVALWCSKRFSGAFIIIDSSGDVLRLDKSRYESSVGARKNGTIAQG